MENSTLVSWVVFLMIGGVIGWLAGVVIRGRGFGIVGDVVIGVVGAFFGRWIAGVFGLYPATSLGVLLVAFAGTVLLVGLTRLIVK